MKFWLMQLSLRPALAGAMLVLPLLSACAKSERASDGRIPVAVHGVNHTAQEFTFVLADPLDVENRAGGETINAYGAGGTMCCFKLPKQWHPGLKVELHATKWIPRTPENVLPSGRQSFTLDIPVYEPGKAAELWILRTEDDTYSIVVSNLQPDHPDWPGKTKGWPVPSMEYRRLMHARVLKEAQSDVELFESSLDDLKNQPVESAKATWDHRIIREAKVLNTYKGPEDPAFHAMLFAEFRMGLVRAQENLRRVEAERP